MRSEGLAMVDESSKVWRGPLDLQQLQQQASADSTLSRVCSKEHVAFVRGLWHSPEGLAVMVHDDCKVGGGLLDLQQPQQGGQEAITDAGVLAPCCLQPLSSEAKVGAVQQRVCIHQYQPAGMHVIFLLPRGFD